MLLGTQDKDFFPEDLIEKFKFVKNMGFECFEIDGKVLTDNVETVKQAIKESGLPPFIRRDESLRCIDPFIQYSRNRRVFQQKCKCQLL